MSGIIMDEAAVIGLNEFNSSDIKMTFAPTKSMQSSLSPISPDKQAIGMPLHQRKDSSVDELYDNILYTMESSNIMSSPSERSTISYVDESQLISELQHLVGGETNDVEVDGNVKDVVRTREDGSPQKSDKTPKTQSPTKRSPPLPPKNIRRPSQSQLELNASTESSPRNKGTPRKLSPAKKPEDSSAGVKNSKNGTEESSEDDSGSPDLGPFLLKQAKNLLASGDNPRRALQFALRAAKSLEKCAGGKLTLDLVMSLHVIAAIYCSLGKYKEAIPVLKKSIEIPSLEESHDHALAKFSGCMQLGDTYAMLGQLATSIRYYTMALEIQKQALGEKDPRVGETCHYLAEAHVQAMQFDEAERLCRIALEIHRESGIASVEETADRRLLGLICETKGDHEAALEHLVLASMAMMSNGQEAEVASVDCSIGDTYLSLARYDEAVFAYQKALTVFKSSEGENHPSVASVFVRLADLYNKKGKFRESTSYCENALRIYLKPLPGTPTEEIASGLTEVSAIYESMDEPDRALKLLQKALTIYSDGLGKQSTIAGIEAQMGVLYFITEDYAESYSSFKSAITKLRVCGEKSALLGITLNQMGLTCVQRYAVNEAAEFFKESASILEQEYGPYHPDTLGVYSNLAGTYDAMGRLGEAIDILEHVIAVREEKLGTANPDVDDEKRRLSELLKEAGRARHRRTRSLQMLLDANPHFG